MSKSEDVFTIRVECYAGYRDEELPRRFFLKNREIKVVEIFDRWLAPEHRYFKVRGDDGALYIIRHDVAAGHWELTMFDALADLDNLQGALHMTMTLISAAFSHLGEIPLLYSCDGQDISPPLSWTGVPQGTKSLALIVCDPDAPDPAAPKMTWVHWVLYNLPSDSTGLVQGIAGPDLPTGTMEGKNDWQRTGYGGPCPPIGRHRYFFTLYALDTVLPDLDRPTKAELEKAMQGHVLAEVELMGTYQR